MTLRTGGESTPEGDVMDVQSIASVAVIAPDSGVSRKLYVDALGKGFGLLHEARTEPWGQTVARLQSSEDAIIGLSYRPSMRS
jgi:hypothetical protein